MTKKKVGEIRIQVNGRYVAQDFIDRSVRAIFGFFLLVFIMSAALALIFHYSTTRPILRLAEKLSTIDVNNREREKIDLLPGHEQDELGNLVVGINTLMGSYDTGLVAARKAEEKTKQSEMRYRILFENSPIGILTTNTTGKILEVNPKLLKILGSPSAESTRNINMFFFPPLVEAGISGNYKECALTGHAGVFETPYTSKWGRRFFMRYHVQPIRGDNGEIIAVQGLMEDISDEKRLEEQLKQSQKMEAIGTLAGGIAHDFNNILQVISGYTQVLLFDKSDKNPDFSNLTGIQVSIGRASQLVRQLLLFSRKAASEFKPVDLNHEVVQAGRLLERTIPKMIEIDFRPDSKLWNVLADPVQIEQIIINLCNNAVDAMPDQGKIIIETENVTIHEDTERRLLDIAPGPYGLLTVSDTGHGMDKATMEKIFDPFFTTKDVGKGTGLGLASVYGMVKSHGGHITCASEPGVGTSFKIYIPAVDGKPVAQTVEPPRSEPATGSETVLLVDDEKSIRDFASQALKKFGYTVLAASSGEDALIVYSSRVQKIDLVLMDLGMPGMGGYKCLSEIKNLNPEAKVLVASGYTTGDQASKTLTAGAAGFIGKPYHVAALLEKVREILEADD